MQEFKEIELQEIFDLNLSKTNDSSFTTSFIHQNSGAIPVYGATKIKNYASYGYIADNIKGIKYFEDCLTFNIDGSAGCFYRKGRFSLSEKVMPLHLKKEFISKVNCCYIAYIIKIASNAYGFGFGFKPNRDRISNIILQIPIDKNGNFDLKKQKEIAKRYQLIEKVQDRLSEAYKTFKNTNVVIDSISCDTKDFFIEEIFNVLKAKKNIVKSKVETIEYSIPVYSAQSTNYGIAGYTDAADFCANDQDILITFGDHTRKFFIRNKNFSITDNVKVLQLKTEFKLSIDIEYFIHTASKLIPNIGYARHWSEAKSTSIPIPIKYDKELDINLQKQMASKYREIEKIQSYLLDNLKVLKNCNIILSN